MAEQTSNRRFSGVDGLILAEKIAEAENEAIADALRLESLVISDLKNGGPLTMYVAEKRRLLIEAWKDLADMDVANLADPRLTLLALQNALKHYLDATRFLTDAITQMQSAPDEADDSADFDDPPEYVEGADD